MPSVTCKRCDGEGYVIAFGVHRPDVDCGGCLGEGAIEVFSYDEEIEEPCAEIDALIAEGEDDQ